MKAILNLVGLAKKAGKVITGNTGIQIAFSKKQIHLLILSNDISKSTEKKMLYMCEQHKVPFLILTDKTSLGLSLGRKELIVVGIIDSGFAQAISNKALSCSEITRGWFNDKNAST